MKKNNKGFVLVETLVVTVFVVAIFSVIYINFYALAGEYERREFYDDVDSKYGTYWIKRFIQGDSFDFFKANGASSKISSDKYYKFQCSDLTNSNDLNLCNEMWKRLDVSQVYITTYELKEFKQVVEGNDTFANDVLGPSFTSYIQYLPDFIVASLNGARYRVLVEFKRTEDSDSSSTTYYTYSNMEGVQYDS